MDWKKDPNKMCVPRSQTPGAQASAGCPGARLFHWLQDTDGVQFAQPSSQKQIE